MDWANWKPKDYAVLCFIMDDDKVLLIEKRRGLGAGKINAPGGRIEPGETEVEAVIRETQEEVLITPIDPVFSGRLQFQFTDGYSLDCAVYRAESYTGTPGETDEALPFWCAADTIPFDRMWQDDQLWIPHMLESREFWGCFVIDGDSMMWHYLDT
ncbi:MAG: 8-oxo-dGTP diphosphatase [Spirochaetia bacterium]